MRKTYCLLTLGAILEYYDFAIFVYFAKAIGASLIPVTDPTANLIASYAVLAIGALIRPLGGSVFAHFGDTRGRRTIFMYTILMMAVPTLAIAFIPSYQQIGISATILLVFLRCVQGLAIGGEIPGSIVFAYELAHPQKRALHTNIVVMGTNIGFFLASFMASLLSNDLGLPFASWRLAFVIGGLWGLVSYFLRKSLSETPAFIHYHNVQTQRKRQPFNELLASNFTPLWQIIAFSSFLASFMSVFAFFMPTYLATFYHFPLATMLKYNSYYIIIFVVCALIAGKWHHYLGKRFLIVSIVLFDGLISWLFPNYANLSLTSITLLHLGIICYLGLLCGRLPVLAASFFPLQVRFSGVALSYNIAFGIIAGTSQVILLSLIKLTGLTWLPALYIIIFSSFALVFLWQTPAPKLVNYS
jgi:predicted MFS family arabinose efflux permease